MKVLGWILAWYFITVSILIFSGNLRLGVRAIIIGVVVAVILMVYSNHRHARTHTG